MYLFNLFFATKKIIILLQWLRFIVNQIGDVSGQLVGHCDAFNGPFVIRGSVFRHPWALL